MLGSMLRPMMALPPNIHQPLSSPSNKEKKTGLGHRFSQFLNRTPLKTFLKATGFFLLFLCVGTMIKLNKQERVFRQCAMDIAELDQQQQQQQGTKK